MASKIVLKMIFVKNHEVIYINISDFTCLPPFDGGRPSSKVIVESKNVASESYWICFGN